MELLKELEVKRKNLSELFQVVKNNMSDSSGEFILELIDADEWGIALETIYDVTSEAEISISRHAYNIIQQLASMMDLNTRDWDSLEYQIIDRDRGYI